MKTYIKPMVEYVELTVEERFASGSICRLHDGVCSIDGGKTVFYWA